MSSKAAEVKKFAKQLRDLGFEVTLEGAHQQYVVRHPDLDGRAWFSTTPSDWRWKKNTLRRIAQEFGVEVRV